LYSLVGVGEESRFLEAFVKHGIARGVAREVGLENWLSYGFLGCPSGPDGSDINSSSRNKWTWKATKSDVTLDKWLIYANK